MQTRLVVTGTFFSWNSFCSVESATDIRSHRFYQQQQQNKKIAVWLKLPRGGHVFCLSFCLSVVMNLFVYLFVFCVGYLFWVLECCLFFIRIDSDWFGWFVFPVLFLFLSWFFFGLFYFVMLCYVMFLFWINFLGLFRSVLDSFVPFLCLFFSFPSFFSQCSTAERAPDIVRHLDRFYFYFIFYSLFLFYFGLEFNCFVVLSYQYILFLINLIILGSFVLFCFRYCDFFLFLALQLCTVVIHLYIYSYFC